MTHPFFSIIIPTLNEEKFLPNLLSDLKKQTDSEFEVIIVDSKSEDATAKIARSYRDNFQMKFISNARRNVSHQRNFGAKKAVGEYLIFLDADAQLGKSFIKNLKSFIVKKSGLIFVPYIDPDESSARSALNFVNFLIELSQYTNKPFSTGGSMIWDRSLFLKLGGFDEKLYLGEDHNIIQRALKWGVRAKFLKKIKIRYSLRRFRKEGQLAMIYKSILATAHILIKGDIRNKIFDYQMGGGIYRNQDKETFKLNLQKNINKIKKFFRKYLF